MIESVNPFLILNKHYYYKTTKPSFLTSSKEIKDILEEISIEQLQELNKQYSLPFEGKETKEQLLVNLQEHAMKMIQKTKERRIVRLEEQGISYNEEEYPDIDGSFYFSIGNQTTLVEEESKNNTVVNKENNNFPPGVPEPNENGERVVTVYSTTDTNDLTGGAGSNAPNVPDYPIGDVTKNTNAENYNSYQDKTNQNEEFQSHVELCNDFLLTILAETGLPAFQILEPGAAAQPPSPKPYTPFDPMKHVSTPILNKITKSLLYQNGEAFHTAVQEIELNAIASDGMTGMDDVTKGGGHYKTVLQLKTFLEGFRSTEARRESRELLQMMLETLVRGGVNELDMVLSNSLKEGVLNDELLGFLNEMIVKQERRIRNAGINSQKKNEEVMDNNASSQTEDEAANVTMVKGEFIETIDLEAFSKKYGNATIPSYIIQEQKKTAQEQLLSLLKYLRERLKVEAAYRTDVERGQYLKTLSYCLRTTSERDREGLIWNAFGKSLEQMEEFCDLVKESMEYAESTSSQLMPGKRDVSLLLDVKELKKIYDVGMDLKKRQVEKAGSGTWR